MPVRSHLFDWIAIVAICLVIMVLALARDAPKVCVKQGAVTTMWHGAC